MRIFFVALQIFLALYFGRRIYLDLRYIFELKRAQADLDQNPSEENLLRLVQALRGKRRLP